MISEFFNFYFYKSLENTNDKIKELSSLENAKSHLALYSCLQKKGRGRKNRIWLSEKGDLTCSFLIKNSMNPEDIGKINLFVVSSLISIFKKIGIKKIEFKWPNDIFVKKKKIAGVLIETNVYKGQINKIIIGIGINFVSKNTDRKINCISLSDLRSSHDAISLFFLISESFYNLINSFKKINFKSLSKDLSKVFINKNSLVTINLGKKIITGRFKEINSTGQLLLIDQNRMLKLNYGEII